MRRAPHLATRPPMAGALQLYGLCPGGVGPGRIPACRCQVRRLGPEGEAGTAPNSCGQRAPASRASLRHLPAHSIHPAPDSASWAGTCT